MLDLRDEVLDRRGAVLCPRGAALATKPTQSSLATPQPQIHWQNHVSFSENQRKNA